MTVDGARRLQPSVRPRTTKIRERGRRTGKRDAADDHDTTVEP
jgi:hypothetical protein